MKKTTLFLITLFSFSLLNAQVEIKPGLKGGLNLANLTNTSNIGVNSKGITSFHIGGTVSFKFAKFYTLQPEILYSKQGITDLFGRNVNTGNGFQTTDINDLVLNKVVQLSVGYQFDL